MSAPAASSLVDDVRATMAFVMVVNRPAAQSLASTPLYMRSITAVTPRQRVKLALEHLRARLDLEPLLPVTRYTLATAFTRLIEQVVIPVSTTEVIKSLEWIASQLSTAATPHERIQLMIEQATRADTERVLYQLHAHPYRTSLLKRVHEMKDWAEEDYTPFLEWVMGFHESSLAQNPLLFADAHKLFREASSALLEVVTSCPGWPIALDRVPWCTEQVTQFCTGLLGVVKTPRQALPILLLARFPLRPPQPERIPRQGLMAKRKELTSEDSQAARRSRTDDDYVMQMLRGQERDAMEEE